MPIPLHLHHGSHHHGSEATLMTKGDPKKVILTFAVPIFLTTWATRILPPSPPRPA